jgi:hypothetical protein
MASVTKHWPPASKTLVIITFEMLELLERLGKMMF